MEFAAKTSASKVTLVTSPELLEGLSSEQKAVLAQAEDISDPCARWDLVAKKLLTPRDNWNLHKEIYENNYAGCEIAPAWIPSPSAPETNIAKMMKDRNMTHYDEFYQWSINSSEDFWDACIKELGVVFDTPYSSVFELSKGVTGIEYLPGAKLNIATSW